MRTTCVTAGSAKEDKLLKAAPADEQWLRGLYLPHMQDAFAEEEAPINLISQVSGSEEPTLLLHADGVYCIRCASLTGGFDWPAAPASAVSFLLIDRVDSVDRCATRHCQ